MSIHFLFAAAVNKKSLDVSKKGNLDRTMLSEVPILIRGKNFVSSVLQEFTHENKANAIKRNFPLTRKDYTFMLIAIIF